MPKEKKAPKKKSAKKLRKEQNVYRVRVFTEEGGPESLLLRLAERGDSEGLAQFFQNFTPIAGVPPAVRSEQARSFDGLASADNAIGTDPYRFYIDVRDEHGRTALHAAALGGHLEASRLLLANGADVNTLDNFSWSPLHCAACSRNENVLQLLVEEPGIRTNCVNEDKNTPLHYLAKMPLSSSTKLSHIFHIMFERGADVNSQNYNGETALHNAALAANEPLALLLLGNGVDPNGQNDHGETALHWCARQGNPKMVQSLLSAGSLACIEGMYGTARDVATTESVRVILKRYEEEELVDHGLPRESQDEDDAFEGSTLLLTQQAREESPKQQGTSVPFDPQDINGPLDYDNNEITEAPDPNFAYPRIQTLSRPHIRAPSPDAGQILPSQHYKLPQMTRQAAAGPSHAPFGVHRPAVATFESNDSDDGIKTPVGAYISIPADARMPPGTYVIPVQPVATEVLAEDQPPPLPTSRPPTSLPPRPAFDETSSAAEFAMLSKLLAVSDEDLPPALSDEERLRLRMASHS